MKNFANLELAKLVDLLVRYSRLYYNLKKEYAGIDKTSNYKKLMEAVLKEIEKRRRTTIGWKPANPELKTA